jgi:hypothetical protein
MSLPAAPPKLDWLAAFLSYLIPGLGHVTQGRIAKGVIYFVCLYGMFFYGMALGDWKNVWLADASNQSMVIRLPVVGVLSGFARDLAYRKEFAGQFGIGIVAWPAVIQYMTTEPIPKSGDTGDRPDWQAQPRPIIGHLMQPVAESTLNKLQADGNRMYDLGWVLTIVAGVLNLLAVYDALAGPMVKDEEPEQQQPAPAGAA